MYFPRQPSVRRTILWALCGLTATTALAVALLTSRAAASVAEARALDDLARDAERTSAQLEAGYQRLAEDARVLGASASLRAFAAAETAGGVDPATGLPSATWADHVAETFAAVMAVRPEYTQIRLISFSDGMPERVRVDRAGGEPQRIPETELQRKAGEPYCAQAAALAPRGVAFSEVTFNREHGRITPDRVPTLRALHSVGGIDGMPLGFIVINVDYRTLIDAAFDGVRASRSLVVATPSGATLEIESGTRAADARFEEGGAFSRGPYVRAMRSGTTGVFETPAGLAHAAEIGLDPSVAGASAWVALEASPSGLFAVVRAARFSALGGALLLVALALVVGRVLSARIAHPLESMAAELARAEAADELPRLQEERGDEIGALARTIVAATRESRRSAARIRAIFDTAVDAVITIDRRGTVLSANRATESLFGYTTDEIVGNKVNMLMPQPIRGEHDGYLERYAHTGEPSIIGRSRKVYARRKDGSTFPIDLSVSECSVDGERTFTGIVRDVSERERVEVERTRLLEDLARSNGELEDFAYVASHDLKAPLRVIDNTSKWLEEDLAEHLDEDTRESMDLLRNRVGRMEKLLDDLLDYARVGRLREADADERTTGAELYAGLRALLAPPEGVTFTSTASFDALDVLRMPTVTLLQNLVSNALKHGGPELTSVVLDGGEDDEMIWMSVEDDGSGIPEDYQERVFRMFHTLRPRDEVEGSGMGLALVKKHVEVAGGHLSLRSEEGHGCRFRFTLPKTAPFAAEVHE